MEQRHAVIIFSGHPKWDLEFRSVLSQSRHRSSRYVTTNTQSDETGFGTIEGLDLNSREPWQSNVIVSCRKKKCRINLWKMAKSDILFSTTLTADEERACVRGILVLSNCIIVGDTENTKLKIFGRNGEFLSSIDSEHIVFGITKVNGKRFATVGVDKQVRLWTLQSNAIVAEDAPYNVDHISHGIHFNGTYFCVLHRKNDAITVLDKQGRQIRKVVMKEALRKKVVVGWDIHMDKTTHNIYVPCIDNDNEGVMCLSVEGKWIWFCSFKEGMPSGITEINEVLCVSISKECCIHALSQTGQYKRKILDKNQLKKGKPHYVYYDTDEKKLYFSVFQTDTVCFLSLEVEQWNKKKYFVRLWNEVRGSSVTNGLCHVITLWSA